MQGDRTYFIASLLNFGHERDRDWNHPTLCFLPKTGVDAYLFV